MAVRRKAARLTPSGGCALDEAIVRLRVQSWPGGCGGILGRDGGVVPFLLLV
jgi:hypothetical protein